MDAVSLVLRVTERGFSVVRLPKDYKLAAISVEDQITTKAGVIAESAALSDLAKVLNETLTEVTGETGPFLLVAEREPIKDPV